jgi:flagellar basal-body rod protein FlgF
MQSNIYVTLSAQMALQRRLDTLANNVANASTAGFRGEVITFEQLIGQQSADPVHFVSRGETHISTTAGELTKTDNALDVALRGNSYLAFQSAAGPVYTRDGRMQMLSTGELATLNGNPFLDVSGSPLPLDPNAGPPTIGKDGSIFQKGRQVGTLGLFRMSPDAKLSRGEGASVIPDIEPQPDLDFNVSGIVQGFVEKSNVNPVLEMTHLIAVQRSFEAVSGVMHDSETSLQDAIKILSGS